MSFLALLLAMQSAEMPARPHSARVPETSWQCDILDLEGNRYSLLGTFPAFPAGWDPNLGVKAEIRGNAPAEWIGTHEVKPFAASKEYRTFYVAFDLPDSGHFNMMITLVKGQTGMATIERYTRGAAAGRGSLKAFATGSCEGDLGGGEPVKDVAL